MQNERRNEHAKLWVFREMEMVATDVPRLTATVVAMDSCRRFSKRWHVTDVKNIAGDDQANLMVNRNYTNIAHIFRFYDDLHLWDRDWCSTDDGNGSCHGLVQTFFKEMTRCRHQKHCRRWSGDPNGRSKFHKYRAYLSSFRLRDCDWCSAADSGFWRLLSSDSM